MDVELLKQVIIDQQQTTKTELIVPRILYNQIDEISKTNHIVVISGIRRCGKSVFMEVIRKKYLENNFYFNFDDDRLVNFELEDFQTLLELFIELYGEQKTIFFDEIQNILGWERFVRRLHDQHYKIYITGSNATMLSKELGTRLTGRYVQLQMYPFSFAEYIRWQQPKLIKSKQLTTTQKSMTKKLFAEFVQNGGLPEYLLYKDKSYLATLYESIIYRDIIVRYKVNEHSVKELALYLASNISKEMSYNSLRKLLGLGSANTVADYCDYFENSYLVFFINRFAFSLKKQINYAKKSYFIDQALAKTVGFTMTEDRGRVLENIVFLELKRRGHDIYFYKENKECDFLIRKGEKIVSAIQVTTTLKNTATRTREIDGLIEALASYDLPEGYILTENEEASETIINSGKKYQIRTLPIWRWLLDF